MQTRRLGRTGHMSTVAIFGTAAFWNVSQEVADRAMEQVLTAGVNHIDVAPSYGLAEQRLGPWMKSHRDRFFLGCKTLERDADAARAELEASLKRLNTDHFDLYQVHAVTTLEELDKVTRAGGSLEAIVRAREEGLTRYIGLTTHGLEAPTVVLEALRRFDFDTVMLPLNPVMMAHRAYREQMGHMLQMCREKDVGVMIIKAIARRPWCEQERRYTTWYEPYDTPEAIQRAVNFVLSYPVTGLATAGDTTLLPRVLSACENFTPLSAEEREAMIAAANPDDVIFGQD